MLIFADKQEKDVRIPENVHLLVVKEIMRLFEQQLVRPVMSRYVRKYFYCCSVSVCRHFGATATFLFVHRSIVSAVVFNRSAMFAC